MSLNNNINNKKRQKEDPLIKKKKKKLIYIEFVTAFLLTVINFNIIKI
jgi:hypothetical protein